MKTILYLEGELKLARQVSAELQAHFEECRVLAANGGHEGLHILKHQPVEVLVLDLNLPGVDGLEILNYATRFLPDLRVIITSEYDFILHDIRQQPWPFPFLRCLGKPFPVKNILLDVESALKDLPAVVINDMPALSILQLAHIEGKDCRLEIITREGEGQFFFQRGNLVAAYLGETSGEAAVAAFLKAKQQSTRIFHTTSSQIATNISAPFDYLLLHCCQMADQDTLAALNSGLAA